MIESKHYVNIRGTTNHGQEVANHVRRLIELFNDPKTPAYKMWNDVGIVRQRVKESFQYVYNYEDRPTYDGLEINFWLSDKSRATVLEDYLVKYLIHLGCTNVC